MPDSEINPTALDGVFTLSVAFNKPLFPLRLQMHHSGTQTKSKEYKMLSVGDKAPQFSLLDQQGNETNLKDFEGQRVLVWFYPKASTPGCTAEGCNLRDNHEEFAKNGIHIVGISMDSVKRQQNFATKQSFPYKLLSDESGEITKAFGAWGRKKFMGREYDGILRSSFLIGPDGVIEKVYDKVKTKTHGSDVLADL